MRSAGDVTSLSNSDTETVNGFGHEWSVFDYTNHSADELKTLFESYFSVFPWDALPPNAVGADVGCGTGRWAKFVAERVGVLHCVDASEAALAVAKRNLAGKENCQFHRASVEQLPFDDGSLDFGYSLGVLHHVPDTARGLADCVRKLKPGAPFMVYLYYALDNRSLGYRAIWRASDVFRRGVSRLPFRVRYGVSQVIAACAYWPLARASWLLERSGIPVSQIPLSAYRHRSFYVMRTDALDRFGTRVEHRFTRGSIEAMMRDAGLTRIRFSTSDPFWTAVGFRT